MSKADDGGSRPSKTNRQGQAQGHERPDSVGPDDMPNGTGRRPVSVEPGRTLRDEAVIETSEGPQAKPWYSVLGEWREWIADYRSMHMEYEGPNGERTRTRLENSYQPRYGKRYYAKLKDLERGIEREYENLTTVMLTFSASNLNSEGFRRCPADHMRDIADGWGTCRKQLHQVLSGYNWEYAKVWEPHDSGYGHMHVAVFVEADGLESERFKPVMGSYVENTKPAGTEAHDVENAVSVNDNVENLGTYISEYIGIFGDETLARPMKEQMFYAVTWATQTRRVEFSNGGQELMKREQFRRETGLEPERIDSDVVDDWDGRSSGGGSTGRESGENLSGVEIDPEGETVERTDTGGGWDVESICTVRGGEPEYSDPTSGGVSGTEIQGRVGVDLPAEVD
jgi:hypothetical protein